MKFVLLTIKNFLSILKREILTTRIQTRARNLRIERPSIFRTDNLNSFVIGDNVHIGAFSEVVVLEKSSHSHEVGQLTIGENVVIGCGANIRAAGGKVEIGDNALVAQNVSIVAANHSIALGLPYRDAPWAIDRTGVIIGENVWIGANATILPGVKIGKNSIIAAGSVVTMNVPTDQMWGGTPAHYIKSIKDEN